MAFNVNAGELNKRIEILALETEQDADGYDVEREVIVHRCWAKFTEQGGTEQIKNDSDFGSTKVRFLIRYTKKEIDRKMTVRYGGKIYKIEYVNRYGDSCRWIEIWCSRDTREGS